MRQHECTEVPWKHPAVGKRPDVYGRIACNSIYTKWPEWTYVPGLGDGQRGDCPGGRFLEGADNVLEQTVVTGVSLTLGKPPQCTFRERVMRCTLQCTFKQGCWVYDVGLKSLYAGAEAGGLLVLGQPGLHNVCTHLCQTDRQPNTRRTKPSLKLSLYSPHSTAGGSL